VVEHAHDNDLVEDLRFMHEWVLKHLNFDQIFDEADADPDVGHDSERREHEVSEAVSDQGEQGSPSNASQEVALEWWSDLLQTVVELGELKVSALLVDA